MQFMYEMSVTKMHSYVRNFSNKDAHIHTKMHNYVRNASNENSIYVRNVSNKNAHLGQYSIHVCRRTFPRESHLVVS